MAYGVEIRRADGSVMYNGLSRGGVLVAILVCPKGQSGKQYFPGIMANDLDVVSASKGAHTIDKSQETGPDGQLQGYVSWTAWSTAVAPWHRDTTLFVYARKRLLADSYGIQLVNDNGEILGDQGYPAPQFAGTVYFNPNAVSAYQTPGGYTANVHEAVINLRPGADKLLVAYLPDVGTNDTWYHLDRQAVMGNEGTVTVRTIVYSLAASYTLPSLHVFAVNAPQPSGETHGLRIFDSASRLTFDATYEGMQVIATYNAGYVYAYNSTTTDTLPAGTWGLPLPYHKKYEALASGSTDNLYLGVGKRVGNQLTTKVLLDSTPAKDGTPSYSIGEGAVLTVPVVDVWNLSPRNDPGVPAPYDTKPVFTQDIAGKAVQAGSVVSWTVQVSGRPTPNLQWYRNNVAISGATGATYSFTAQSGDNGAQYFCRATNTQGSQNSSTAVLYVVAPSITPASITSYGISPSSATTGDTVTLSIAATGTQPLTLTITGPRGTIATASNVSSLSQTITTTSSDGGSYGFSASNSDASGTYQDYRNATLTLTDPSPPVITQQPSDMTVTQNSSASLTCTATPAGVEYYWSRQWGSTTEFYGSGSTIPVNTSTTGVFYYTCEVRNQLSTYSRTATVTVQAGATYPNISQQPANQTITAGQNATFSCTASPATGYQWYQNNAPISGKTGNSMSIGPLDTGYDGCEYFCRVYNNSVYTDTSVAILHVNPAQVPATYPSYNNPPDYYIDDIGSQSWSASGSNTSSGAWANGAGDPGLYSIMASNAGGSAPANASYDTWYNLSGGVTWKALAPASNGSRTITFTWKIQLNSTGSIVSSGKVTLIAEWSTV